MGKRFLTFCHQTGRMRTEKKEFKNYLMRGNNLTNIPTQNKRWKSESVTQGLDSPGIEY